MRRNLSTILAFISEFSVSKYPSPTFFRIVLNFEPLSECMYVCLLTVKLSVLQSHTDTIKYKHRKKTKYTSELKVIQQDEINRIQ